MSVTASAAFLALALGMSAGLATARMANCSAESRYFDQCNGQRQYAKGISYSGGFVMDRPEGSGTMVWPDGVSFTGVFAAGRPTATGIYRDRTGSPVAGLDRRAVELIRSGRLEFASGNSYEGEHRNRKPHGRGTYFYRDGTSFHGTFVDGVRTGPGTEYDRTGGIRRSGEWSLDELVRPDAGPPQAAAATRPVPSQPAPQSIVERRVALVIGNAAYRNSPLLNPANDATDMASALRALGFEVTLVTNVSILQMREVTRQFADKVKLSDVALIYYAGHGVEVKGRNYLLPIDVSVVHEYELEDQAFDAGRWLDMLEHSQHSRGKRVNILILDACRDNAFSRGWRSSSRGLARMDAPAGSFIAFSTAPGKVAADGERQRNSPFTRHLIRAIQTPNLPIELVFKEVRKSVIADTRNAQVPWDNSSLVGDFSFRPTR